MRELYVEGVAIHDDPESCDTACEGDVEAFDRGTYGLGIEPRNQSTGTPTPLTEAEGNTLATRFSCGGPDASMVPRGRRPLAASRCWRSPECSARREGHEPQADDERSGEVRRARSTDEVIERCRCSAEEMMEGRGSTKGNTDEHAAHRTQSRVRATDGLDRVREAARGDRKLQFTALSTMSPSIDSAQRTWRFNARPPPASTE